MKTRALAEKTSKSVTGNARYLLYRKGISRIKDSITKGKGYYLEAITLCESLIADRLESRSKFLTKSDRYSFKPLGKLQEGILYHETNNELKSTVGGKLDDWRVERNNALHAIVKLEDKNIEIWEDR